MNNLAYYLARLYYAAAHQSISVVPSGFTEEFWAERLYRLIAGFPDKMAGGKNTSFWLELLFYKKTNQTYRQATGTYPAWFWLSKLYAFYSGQSTNAILQPANAAFWAEKLLSLSTFEVAQRIEVTGNGNVISNGDATPSLTDYTQFTTKNAADNSDRTFTINNTGNASVTGINVLVPSGYTLTSAPSATIAASGTTTFTVRCNSATPGSAAGNITIESTELADYVFAVACTVRSYLEKLVTLNFNQLLALSETTGTNADDATSNNLDGTYSGVTLNQGTFTDGTPYGTWDGVNDYVDAFSAGLASAFSLSAGTLACWVKMDAAKWEDASFQPLIDFAVDSNNRVILCKHTSIRRLAAFYVRLGGVVQVLYDIPITPGDFVHVACTWGGGNLRLYYNGAEVGTPAAITSFAGTLATAYVGRDQPGSGFMAGNIKYAGYKNTGMSAGDLAIAAAIP